MSDQQENDPDRQCVFHVSRLPQLVEAQVQPSSKVAVGVAQEVWNVLAVVPDEGKLLEQQHNRFRCSRCNNHHIPYDRIKSIKSYLHSTLFIH